MARVADWYKVTKDGEKPALPPMHVIRDMLATPNMPLPILEDITETPTFASDGTLHFEPGYSPRNRVFYAPPPNLIIDPIPAEPSQTEIEHARKMIVEELLGDFPFVGDPERAHAIALTILPSIRLLIVGPSPLHLVEKPLPGTGASLLVDAIALIWTGRPVTCFTEGRDEDEWRKRITARLRSSAPILLIDNLRRRLDSAALSAAITSTTWEDRLLGTSEILRLPVRCAWVATGNNPALSSEMARRSIRIRLDAKMDQPWLRTDFRHSNLIDWVKENRGRLVHAVLTLGQAWLAQNRPIGKKLPVFGMFESWTTVIGGILSVAGIPGFLGNLSDFYESTDSEAAAIRIFVATWWELFKQTPVGVADLLQVALKPEVSLDLGDKGEHSQRIRFGKLMSQLRDRIYQIEPELSLRIAAAGTEHRALQWQLAVVCER